ncbi:hypothetical protein HYDPIDRAFT_23907 [Hydnomerulius pinastri MD-312]|nr:hypothetical protein HYDPIDRAFT_23907 [Hydnomerulius pinastri MD-312]
MVNETRPIAMPYYQIRQTNILCLEANMEKSEFGEFKSMIRFTAKECLDDSLRPEDQDPDAFKIFLETVNQRDPDIARRYEHSWIVLGYLEQYLNSRRRDSHKDRRTGPRKRIMRCPEPIWVRFAQAQESGTPIRRNCQVLHRASTPGPRPQLRRSARTTTVTALARRATNERKQAVIEPDGDEQPNAPCHSTPGPTVDPVLAFLRTLRPSLEDFHSHFADMGIQTSNDLNNLFSWPIKDQESAMRVQFDQKMNFMQLNGLLVGLRNRAVPV